MNRRGLPARLRHDDDGMGLVLVLGVAGVLTALMVVSTQAGINALQSSRKHVSFESSVAVAEAGIDTVLARAQKTYSVASSDTYLTPSPTDTTCAAASVAWPFTSQPTVEQEQTWARDQLEAIAANAACRVQTSTGDFVVLKPSGRQTVYAMGWAPRYGAAEAKRRILKAEYLFTPYKPTHAILSSGNMSLGSSTVVTSAPPNDPLLAAVHTNGSLTVDGGNPEVYGPVTQSGSSPSAESTKFHANAGGDVYGKAKQSIAFPGAASVWYENRSTAVPGGWYDLCPDGTARRPDGASPCTGSVLASASFRGWSFNGSGAVPVWDGTTAIKTGGYSGTYYVHHGDVTNSASNSGSPVPNLTVIASSSTTTCNKIAGNITWGSTDPLAPSLANTWLIADQDLKTTSNYQAGSASGGTVVSGFFIAGDQVSMSTSSNGAYGAVIAADQCDPPDGQSLVDGNSIINPSIYYDPNAKAPFIDVINTTLWLEYPNA